MRKTITLLLFCVLALTGCNYTSSGTITQKTYKAPYETVETDYDCVSYRDGKCTMKVPDHETVQHDAEYLFDLKQGDKTGRVSVTEDDYNKHEVGDCWAC